MTKETGELKGTIIKDKYSVGIRASHHLICSSNFIVFRILPLTKQWIYSYCRLIQDEKRWTMDQSCGQRYSTFLTTTEMKEEVNSVNWAYLDGKQ